MLLSPREVAQLFEALRYKQQGRGFDSRWCHGMFRSHNPSQIVCKGLGTANISWVGIKAVDT